jgi:phosphoglycolate phosphatase
MVTCDDIVFDLDGTLVDSVGQCARIVNDMLRARGAAPTVTAAQTRPLVSVGGAKMVSALLGTAGGDPEAEIAEFRVRYAELPTPEDSLFPGAEDALRTLASRGYRLSICSNKPQCLCEKVVRELGLCDLFGAVVGRQQGRPAKPDPAHLDETLLRAGGRRSRAVYVGDSEVDVELARNAGVPLIFVAFGYGAVPRSSGEVLVASRFADLPALVERCLSARGAAAA